MTFQLLVILALALDIFGISKFQQKTENIIKKEIFSKNKSGAIRNDIDIKGNILPIKISKAHESYMGAKNIAVLDVDSAYVLYNRNGDEEVPIASLTKIMTAVIALEDYKLDDVITVPKEATDVLPGATIYLQEGEEMTVSNLLYGLLLYSSNGAAYTLASKMGQDKFVGKMNEKAKELGLTKASFEEPSGLSDKNRSTARELAHLIIYALKNQVFAKIINTNEKTITSIDGKIVHQLKNTNRLLRDYPGTIGGKTGYTEQAGHCLIAVVERERYRVISVVLNSPSDQFAESRSILDWAFGSYNWP